MTLVSADRQLLIRQLADLSNAVEEMLLSGLTTASEATRKTFDVTFREASRLRLLRLASTLRQANEEIGRYVSKSTEFSAKRLAFFLNRAWLLARGLLRALQTNDDTELARLMWTPSTTPIEKVDVVTLGVSKKVAKGAFCAFEYRLRDVADTGENARGLSWSCVFPLKADNDVPAEAFLQLPQKQKFKASDLLEAKVVTITKALIAQDEQGNRRLTLSDQSTVTRGEAFTDWSRFQQWTPAAVLQRIRAHEPTPFELEVELQDEIVLHDWTIGEAAPEKREGQIVYPVQTPTLSMEAVVPATADGAALRKQLDELRKRPSRPPLFGLLHFERAQLILQPLSVFEESGPKLLTISNEAVDRAALLKTMKF